MTETKSTRVSRLEGLTAWQRTALLSGVCLALLIVLFLAAEGAVRVRAWLKYGQANVRIEDTYRFDEKTGLRTPKPGYSTSRITINSLGFRGPEFEPVKPAGTYRIAFLGGSTTYCAEVSSNEATWPHLVVEALKQAHPDRTFDYVNAAVPGYTTIQSLKRFESEVAALGPDLVVIYHASNDLSSNSRKAANALGWAGDRGDRGLSWASQWSLLIYLVEKNLRILALREAGDDDARKVRISPEAIAQPFEASLRDLIQLVMASGAKVALATFSTRVRADQTPDEQQKAVETNLYYMPYMTVGGLIDSYSAYNEVIRMTAEKEGATLIEAADAIPGRGSHFVDSIHFNDQGAATMARVVTPTLSSMIR